MAILSGLGQPGLSGPSQPGSTTTTLGAGEICGIFGTTYPYSSTRLARLYPNHAAFVKMWDAATARLVKEGYLLHEDAVTLDRVAAESLVGRAGAVSTSTTTKA